MARANRKRRRDRKRNAAAVAEVSQKFAQPFINVPLYELATEEQLETLDDCAMQVIEELGLDFYDDEIIAVFKAHGADVTDYRVRMSRDMVREYVAKAPSTFTQLARNDMYNVQFGDKHVVYAPVYGPPFVYDLDRGRREAVLEDFQNIIKMAYMSPYIHHSGGTVCEPMDEANHTRHLDMVYSHIKYSEKAFMGSVTSGANAADSVAMAEILFGADNIRQAPALLSLINVSSPRQYDDRMLGAIKVYAKARQALLITPFIMSGATGPVSIAGTAIQLHAETLAGIALVQMLNPGSPVIYGSFQTNIDLQGGAPMMGTSEAQSALYLSGQLARKYKLPYRSGGMFASSKIPDAQAAYESAMAMQAAVLGGVNFVLHAAGWLENGLAAGYEKFVLDNIMLGHFHKFMQGLDMSENGLAMDGIREVEIGSHHLGSQHTMRNFRTAFYKAELFDFNSAEQWLEEGGLSVAQKANARYKSWLKEYEQPPLDPAIDEALQAYMAKRKDEIEPEY